MAAEISVKLSSERKEASLELSALSFTYSTLADGPSFPAILSAILSAWPPSVCCISGKKSNQCTVRGRGIPVPGLRLISRQYLNPPMARGGCHPQQVFHIFLKNGKNFFANSTFRCRLILGTSVHEKVFQIGPTVLALKLDKGRVLGGGGGGNCPYELFYLLF